MRLSPSNSEAMGLGFELGKGLVALSGLRMGSCVKVGEERRERSASSLAFEDIVLVCYDEAAESKGKALRLPAELCSYPHLWSQTGSDRKKDHGYKQMK